MASYGFSDCIRVNVGTESENKKFLLALAECLVDIENA